MRTSRAVLCFVTGSALLAAGLTTSHASEERRGSERVTLTEGTNIVATVSPDRQSIIMDVQGVLWRLGAGGGEARRITDPLLEATRPDWSPRGDLVAFQAYAGGTFHVWTMTPGGDNVRQLTFGHGDHRDPTISPDGTKVAFSSDRAFEGSYDIWVAELATGALQRITSDNALEEFEPSWSPDGTRLAFVSGTSASATRIEVIDGSGARTTFATAPAGARFNSPSWSPEGKNIAYVQFASNRSQLFVSGRQVAPNNDVFPFPARWLSANELLYTADGKVRILELASGSAREVPFEATVTLNRPSYRRKHHDFDSLRRRQAKGIVGPALSPDGRRVAFQALNQIWVADLHSGRSRQMTVDRYYKSDPAWSPDGAMLAYSSDKAGTPDIYVLNLASRSEERVTSLPGAEVSAAWSPDGRAIAFQDQTGATHVVTLGSGDTRMVIPSLFAPGKPSWSANGNTIAIAAIRPYTRRFREGQSQMLTADVATGELRYWEPAPFKSISTRGEDGPVYSPDGTAVAFSMESALWVMPVDGNGHPAGEARRVTNEPTDAPTWSGDSRSLLYLSNGRLRLVSRNGGAPRTADVDLDWRPSESNGKTVIRAGRFWSGRGPNVQSDVDITIVDNRIVSIEPHRGRGRHDRDTKFIDASQRTVIPGLWETHTHEWISGKFFGSRLGRLWLAYGVTSLQSVGDPVYRAAETREAYASGSRVGPRFFATGEALDGERVFYNFMRPVTGGAGQLFLEQLRAKAIEYDMIKTYVRLSHAEQAAANSFAHETMGVWTASHYMLPGMAFGVDGMTHLSATTRLGYAYTRSAAGISYQDVRDLFAESGMFVISTTFNPSLYAEDPAMVDDQRLVTLNPPWEQMALRAKRDAALNTDQTISLERLKREEDTIREILRRGGVALAGTDSPLDNPATALHLNLRAQVKYGLAPWEALQTATSLAARTFGVERDLGTLERGKLADLVIIDGNPLENIADADNVFAVMKNGRLYTLDELMFPFAAQAEQASTAQSLRLLTSMARWQREPGVDVSGRYWWHDPRVWQAHEGCGH